MRLLICTLAAVLVSACASTQPSQTELAQRELAKEEIAKSIESGKSLTTSDGTEVVCRSEKNTTTRLKSKKVCMTKDEWLARSNAARDAFDEANRSPQGPKGN